MTPQGNVMSNVKTKVSAEEWRCRVELAACYRLMAHFGVRDLTYNHISARVEGEPGCMLLKPEDHFFEEVTASGLSKYKLDGTPMSYGAEPLSGPVMTIHAGILAAKPDIGCVMHTHTPANIGVSSQEHGLLPISQHAVIFHNRIAYHDFKGFEMEDGMRNALLEDLGDKSVALMRNHGALVIAPTIAEAFVKHHFLEFACRGQVAALAGGTKILIPDEATAEFAARQMEIYKLTENGGRDWAACLRLADRLDSSFRL
jgi:ribulose-5-phosphate 4-epimerase/fuculose-1-phosphate aldolase